MRKGIRFIAADKAVASLRFRKLENRNLSEIITLAYQIIFAKETFDNDFSIEGRIAKEIGKTTYQSFCRYGDRNSSTAALILQWISNTGTPLDVQAQTLSETYGIEITPKMLAKFIIDHDHGIMCYHLRERIIILQNLFKEIAEFNFNERWMKQHILIEDKILDSQSYPF